MTCRQFVVTYNALYILTTIIFKVGLAIFFLRIVVVRWQRLLIYISTAIYALHGIVFIFVVTFRCRKPKNLLINAARGKCISDGVIMPMLYISGILNSVVGVIFAILPVIVLSNSMMPLRAKISAGILLSMGCIGTIASIVRIAYLDGLMNGSRPLHYRGRCWSTLRCGARSSDHSSVSFCSSTIVPQQGGENATLHFQHGFQQNQAQCIEQQQKTRQSLPSRFTVAHELY